MSERPIPAVLSIAGSDSGGGAGIQADLKAFARCGVHGMTAITALTAQNTVAVTGIQPVPGDFIVAQVRAVADDIGVDAVKIGMLGTAETVHAVRKALDLLQPETPIVLDPVMVAESGAVLLDGAARAAIVAELLPRATVITPNVPEARVLAATADEDGAGRRSAGAEDQSRGAGTPDRDAAPAPEGADDGRRRGGAATPAGDDDERRRGGAATPAGDDAERRRGGAATAAGDDDVGALARRLHLLGPVAVVVTGGHRDAATDVFFDGDVLELIPGARHPDGAAHGSGCTHSSALAAHLALGATPLEAARAAKRIAGEAVRDGIRGLGAGAGPVDVCALTARRHARLSGGRTASAPLP